VPFDESGLIREMAFDESGLIREVAFDESGLIREGITHNNLFFCFF
jgi:hypothetical protein